jgi:deoxyribonuclease-4
MRESKIFLGPAGVGIGCKSSSTVDGIRYVREVGLNAMEVEFVRGVKMNNSLAKECGRTAQEAGVDLSVHAPYFINLCSTEKAKVDASIKRIMDSVERAHYMGACVVAIHPGYYGKMGKDEAYAAVKDSLKRIIEKMKNSGFDDVALGLETTGKHTAFGTLDEIVSLCGELQQCAPVVDFAHIYARQGGKIDYGKVLDSVKVLGLKHIHSHFSNIEFTVKGERRHLPLDHSPAFEPLAKELIRRRTGIAIICESPLLEKDSLRMKAVLENLGYDF